ncbi:MAG: hypothetical protein P4L99_18885, partial [Chthoniobacter sp.]|nr:hypothetical protein [Chthoniobacter sp.]
LGCIHRWLQPRPHLIADQFSLRDFAHPKLPSSFAQRVQIIREHCLVSPVWEHYPDIWEIASLNPGMRLHGNRGYSVGEFHEFLISSHWPCRGTITVLNSVITLGTITPLGWMLYNGLEEDHIHGEIEMWNTIRLQNVPEERLEATLLSALEEFSNAFGHPLSIATLTISEALSEKLEKWDDRDKAITLGDIGVVHCDETPLRLFYYGKRHDDKAAAFLQFYRILEFYFSDVGVKRLVALRKSEVSDDEFAKKAVAWIGKKEEENLFLLLESLPSGMIAIEAFKLGLSGNATVKNLSTSLYKFRNSAVHAKANSKEALLAESPITEDSDAARWSDITKRLAGMAIAQWSQKYLKLAKP